MKKLLLITLMLTITFGYSQKGHPKTQEWEVKNMSINDKGNNIGPAFYGSNKVVFSSTVGGRLHLFSGNFTKDDITNKNAFLPADTHEMAVTFTKDLQTMYFTKSLYGEENTVRYDKDKPKSLAIFKATRSGNSWTNITAMPFNNPKYDVAHPSLSNDGSKLYFSSNMPGTLGRSDIFVVKILGDNNYSKPRNLGNNVNTKGSELYPYVSSDNKLYFSSTGHNSLGGMDIFSSDISGSTKAYRLKSPINSRYDDFSYAYKSSTKQGFFTSNRPKGKGGDDVYLFQLKEKEEEKKEEVVPGICGQKLVGTVYLNATQETIPNALILLKDENEKVLKEFQTNGSAKFFFNVDCSTTYKIEASKDGYKTSEKIMVTNAQSGVLARKNIFLTTASKTEVVEKPITVWTVFFEYNKTNLERHNAYQLDKAIMKLKKNPKLRIHFESHTDSRAETDFNMQLSKDRIEVLKEYVGFRGIFRKRFSGEAFGETKPLNGCTKEVECTEAQYLDNRRTTFVLTEE